MLEKLKAARQLDLVNAVMAPWLKQGDRRRLVNDLIKASGFKERAVRVTTPEGIAALGIEVEIVPVVPGG